MNRIVETAKNPTVASPIFRESAASTASLNKSKVVHLTSVHTPYDPRIFHKECKTLVAGGYEVVLIVPPSREEGIVDGVRIRSVPLPTSRYDRMLRSVWNVLHAALKERADLYHFHDPELLPIGVILKLCGKRVIYDVHEDVPQDILDKDYIAASIRRPLAWSVGIIEGLSARLFDGIVTATPAIARHFHVSNTVIVQNFPLAAESDKALPLKYRDRPLVAAYSGGVTAIRGIREMVRAMSLLPETLDARLLIAGKFSPPELEHEVRNQPGWKHVDYVGFKPLKEIPNILAGTRIGLVLYHPLANHTEAQLTNCSNTCRPAFPSSRLISLCGGRLLRVRGVGS